MSLFLKIHDCGYSDAIYFYLSSQKNHTLKIFRDVLKNLGRFPLSLWQFHSL